jgi:osmoprotectant transport system ATP-binding protein
MTDAMITFDHVSKKFAGKTIIPDLSLSIPQNQIFVLVGRSGSGKTTTLKMINALIRPEGGTIKFAGKNLNDYNLQELRWQIGYVLQQIALFPNMTVAQNVAVIPEMRHVPASEITERTRKLLDACGLDPDTYMNRHIDELSGGEAQRVGIVRALAADPPTILMDEPFSALDPLSRRQLQDLVLDLQTKLHKTIVFVTHDMNEALKMGDQIAVMDAGQILQIGTPTAIRDTPATAVVADLFAGTQPDDALAVALAQIVTDGYGLGVVPDTAIPVAATTTLAAVLDQLAAGAVLAVTVHGTRYAVDGAAVLRFLGALAH